MTLQRGYGLKDVDFNFWFFLSIFFKFLKILIWKKIQVEFNLINLIFFKKGYDLKDVGFYTPADYALPSMHDGGGGGNAVCSEYPQTDSQYAYMLPSDHLQVCLVSPTSKHQTWNPKH